MKEKKHWLFSILYIITFTGLDGVCGSEPYAVINEPLGHYVFTKNGDRILTPYGSTGVSIWDTGTGERIRHFYPLEGRESDVLAVAASPDGETAAALSITEVIIFNMDSGNLIRKIGLNYSGGDYSYGAIAYSPSGKYLAAAGKEDTSVFDLQSGEVIFQHSFEFSAVDKLQFFPDGRRLYVENAGQFLIFDIFEKRLVYDFNLSADYRSPFLYGENMEKALIPLTYSFEIRDLNSYQKILEHEKDRNRVFYDIHKGGKRIVTATRISATPLLVRYEALDATGEITTLRTYEFDPEGSLFRIRISPDGSKLVVGRRTETYLYDVSDLQSSVEEGGLYQK